MERALAPGLLFHRGGEGYAVRDSETGLRWVFSRIAHVAHFLTSRLDAESWSRVCVARLHFGGAFHVSQSLPSISLN